MIKSTVLQMFWRFLLPQRPARWTATNRAQGVCPGNLQASLQIPCGWRVTPLNK